ncbi:MAG: hypothetical protein IJ059_05780 [Prevotella sp.]|nr:hypothetical protein [Prevotella sp.]
MCFAAHAMAACGGKSSGSSSSDESSSNAGGLPDGKWPAAIYDKYGIPEIETKGRIVFTELNGEDQSYQYRVYYNGVTAEEMQAWVKTLQGKGFRVPKYTQERINNGRSDLDAILYQPEEKKDKFLRMSFDFERPMEFDYWVDEPNPAFEVKERDEQYYIEYNFAVSLGQLTNKQESEGSFDALGIKAEDLGGIPNVRRVNISSGATGGTISVGFYGDHQLAEGDMDAIHNKLADVMEAKGVKCSHTFSGKEMTAEQLKADKVRSYTVEKDGKKFLMMAMTDDRIGDFGGHIDYRFMPSNK